jgi:hypothetical protein
MLSLAVWISGHTTGIFEIELDFLPWMPQFQRLRLAATVLGNTASFLQDLPDRCLRAWQAHVGLCEGWIAMQIIQDGFWPRDAAQVLWRGGADFQDALHNRWL